MFIIAHAEKKGPILVRCISRKAWEPPLERFGKAQTGLAKITYEITSVIILA